MKMKSLLVVALSAFLLSCVVGIKKMNNLSLGMTKEQVKANVGDSYLIRGAVVNNFNQSVEVWEYDVRKRHSVTKAERYWLYMVDGKLVQWGKAGDWATESTRLKDVQFSSGPQ